jgi:hypothetical protein
MRPCCKAPTIAHNVTEPIGDESLLVALSCRVRTVNRLEYPFVIVLTH